MTHWLRCPVVLIVSFLAFLAFSRPVRHPRAKVLRPSAVRSDRLVLRKPPSSDDSPLPLLGARRTVRQPASTQVVGTTSSDRLAAPAPEARALKAGLSAAKAQPLRTDKSPDLPASTGEGGWEHRPATCLQPASRSGSQARNPRSWQIHRVVDGDDLPSLARRYLDDADRYLEIFHANRQVLSRPDVLPLGTDLRIPAAP